MTENHDAASIHVVLVEPEIHWNTGNAGRTCLAAGASLHLIEPLGFSLQAREVRRAGLDYWSAVQPTIWESWEAFETHLPALGTPAFFSPAADRTLWEADLTPPCVLVFGAETRGLSTQILEDHRRDLVSIPQSEGTVRSLNLSTCVGIAVYEARRRAGRSISCPLPLPPPPRC